jgi:hypothetical protein
MAVVRLRDSHELFKRPERTPAGTIAEALVVIGWVILSAPIAILGTDIWILLGRRRAYRNLVSGRVEIRSA